MGHSSTRFLLDQRFEAAERLVPFCRDAVKVVAEIVDRLRVELVEAFAAGADAAHNLGVLENPQVFGDRLAREMRAVCELRNRARLTAAEPRQQRQTSGIAQSSE